ncbi:MAG: alpha-glucan family phosphorylase [Acidobacteria bacterium]|nr:alpha-glucan family phosphorylase [Acidobacteriota bacterium]MCA1638841.1 alpha-glucan family phosphorylase [Acidobacteriota bacterium]
MKETSNETFSDMQPVAKQQITEQIFRNNFYFDRELPENLRFLDRLAWNFFWSWRPEGINIWRELDPYLWDKTEQNPRLLLKQVCEFRLWQKANDANYVEKTNHFANEFENYLSQPANCFGKITTQNPVAYFCAEYGVHNSLPNYSGGLGILAGDHLKSASDKNVPLVAVGLLYRFGYFRQKIAHNGWQQERYFDSFVNELALQPVLDEMGERILVMIHMRGREVFAQAWLAQIGRISLYLLDTNISQNAEIDQLVTGHLYGGDAETRVVQEKILGIGGVRLLKKLGIEPTVYHLNEGHSAFLTLELAREFLEANENTNFSDAVSSVREKCVFTTHTPVSAGNDTFSPDLIAACFDENFINALKISKDELFALGRTNVDDKEEWFGMTPLALRMTRSTNGVSEKHGEVSRTLWLKMFPEKTSADEVPITHITNGVHASTWIAPAFQTLYEKHIGANWAEVLEDKTAWRKAIEKIPDAAVWNTHRLLKQLLIAFVRQKTFSKEIGSHDTINEHRDTRKLFDADVLTVGFARRVAGYKRWNLLFNDLERLLKMVNDAEKPVQFVFAGKAHPQDIPGKEILQNLMSVDQNSEWQRRAVFVEDYDQEVARYLTQGVDVWLNVPRRPLEASGTSGQKAAMNGGLNLSILDGWWIEGFNGENGFSIGTLSNELTDEEADINDAESLYQILETEVIPAYYLKGENDLPGEWIRRMKNALATLTPQFSSDRMVKDYIEKIYL